MLSDGIKGTEKKPAKNEGGPGTERAAEPGSAKLLLILGRRNLIKTSNLLSISKRVKMPLKQRQRPAETPWRRAGFTRRNASPIPKEYVCVFPYTDSMRVIILTSS